MTDQAFTMLAADRVVLRRFRPADAIPFARYRSLPEVARYQDWESPFPVAEAARFVAQMQIRHPDAPGQWFQFALTRRGADTLIGDCGVGTPADDPRQVEIGFTVAPAMQGQGYATEAVRTLIDYLFNDLGKHRITAGCDPRNTSSAALLTRVGMRQVGHSIESYWSKGEWADDLRFAVLRREWRSYSTSVVAPAN